MFDSKKWIKIRPDDLMMEMILTISKREREFKTSLISRELWCIGDKRDKKVDLRDVSDDGKWNWMC